MPPEDTETATNYLREELYDLVQRDTGIFDFVQFAALDGLWYWDVENPEEEWMNTRFWEVLGYNPEEMPHKSAAWQDIIFEEDRDKALENFTRHCADPSYPYDQTVRYRHAKGHTVWIRCRGMAVRNEDGQATRMLGAHMDITPVIKAQEALADREREAILTRVVGNLAHNFNGKMLVILGEADQLKEELADQPAQANALDAIIKASEDITKILQGLLGITSQEQMRNRRTRLAELEPALCERMRASSEIETMPEIIVSELCSRNHEIDIDEFHFALAVIELVKNSEEASQNPQIIVSLDVEPRGPDTCLVLRVADRGRGIDPEVEGQIFDPFFSTKAVTMGRGLGLTYAERVVKKMNGSLTVMNRPDQGVEATMCIPVVA